MVVAVRYLIDAFPSLSRSSSFKVNSAKVSEQRSESITISLRTASSFRANLVERLEEGLRLLSKEEESNEGWGISGIGSYLNADEDAPKYHIDTLDDTLEGAILVLLRENPSMPQAEIAKRIGKSLPTVKRPYEAALRGGRYPPGWLEAIR